MRFGSIEFMKEKEKKPVTISKVPKDEIEPFIEALELAINNIAVEPISIERRKGLMGKMEWKFKKNPRARFITKALQADDRCLRCSRCFLVGHVDRFQR